MKKQRVKSPKGHFHARADLVPRAMYVVYPGEDRYPLADGVEALPVSEVARIAELARDDRGLPRPNLSG